MAFHHSELLAWRESLGLSKAKAARLLELSQNWYWQLEAGYTNAKGELTPISNQIALACAAIAFGLEPFQKPKRPI